MVALLTTAYCSTTTTTTATIAVATTPVVAAATSLAVIVAVNATGAPRGQTHCVFSGRFGLRNTSKYGNADSL